MARGALTSARIAWRREDGRLDFCPLKEQQQRPMSLVNPSMQPPPRPYSTGSGMANGNAPQLAPLPAFAPSIAPSERSNVGLSKRYRSVAPNNDTQSNVSSSLAVQASGGASQTAQGTAGPVKGIRKPPTGMTREGTGATREYEILQPNRLPCRVHAYLGRLSLAEPVLFNCCGSRCISVNSQFVLMTARQQCLCIG